MSIVPCPSGGPARPPTPPNLADLRFRRKPAAGICGLGPSPRARGAKHGGNGGRRHGGFWEEEFAGGVSTLRKHTPNSFPVANTGNEKVPSERSSSLQNLRVSFLRALRVLRRRQRTKNANGLAHCGERAYRTGILVWPLFPQPRRRRAARFPLPRAAPSARRSLAICHPQPKDFP